MGIRDLRGAGVADGSQAGQAEAIPFQVGRGEMEASLRAPLDRGEVRVVDEYGKLDPAAAGGPKPSGRRT